MEQAPEQAQIFGTSSERRSGTRMVENLLVPELVPELVPVKNR